MEKILSAPKFQQKLAEIVQEHGGSIQQANAKAKKYLAELYTVQQPVAGLVATEMAQYILSRGYDKTIDINTSEVKKVSKLMRKHPIAFVMTHKTYIDMFVLAVVLARHGLPLPYTFSGINMAFLGVGQFGRQAGVIFIRRSFKDNLIYKATLRHFIASLVDEKASFMWAIEGTRSRTGKLVWPKMGILKYIMEGEQDSPQEVKYIPVSIVYDLIPDVKEMTKEGRGKKKKAEDLLWFMNYIREMGDNFGRISLRFGDPVDIKEEAQVAIPTAAGDQESNENSVSKFALELAHRINQITPVTTTSLVCNTLLSKYALSKRAIEGDIADLMQLIETHKKNALVDRGKPIGESVQIALNLLGKANIVEQHGGGIKAKYRMVTENYLPANYYANMAVHHLYHRAFIELALLKVSKLPAQERLLGFWQDVMGMRDVFKFEFFYSQRAVFSDEIESDLKLFADNWEDLLLDKKTNLEGVLQQQKILVAPAVLFTYTEAYRVVAHCLQKWDVNEEFDEKVFIGECLLLGGEMHWQGGIHRIEAVSKPFLMNGIRLIKNRKLIPTKKDNKHAEIQAFLLELKDIARRINDLQEITLTKPYEIAPHVPLKWDIVPGSKTASITQDILESESGAHIGAFFDLDRTLIKGFSAKEFFQTRFMSGKVTTKEVVAQFAGVIVYAMGNGNFAGLAAISTQGVNGIAEQVFIDVGEEVYTKYLANEIYPEARAMVAAHMAKGHTVAIISAATPYQVDPIARDLGIQHIMCTRMEVKGGLFTGKIVEPACWGDGKAYAARQLTEEYNLDLKKSYFYTDSAEDMPLLEIVGKPRPMNPDSRLSAIAFKNDWPVYRFNDEKRGKLTNVVRTGLAAGTLFPAVMAGIFAGARNVSWRDGVNSMMANVGDLGTAMAGIKLAVKGEEHLWSARPAVFLFNHQSSADLLITSKLVRKNAVGVAKKELKNIPIIGQMMQAAGIIFLDRKNKDKAIEALKPAVDALQNGTSVIIAPEGTRSYDYRLGKFKKGAFHLAMQAGVPLVPIIIKNAHDALPRGTSVMKPALIEIVVLEPILTTDWTLENMNERIEVIRDAYLNELGQIKRENV